MSDNGDLRIGIGASVDQASIEAAKAAIKGIGDTLNTVAESEKKAAAGASGLQKALGDISRAAQLKTIGEEMGTLAKNTQDVGGAVSELEKKLKELGASKDEIRGVASAFENARTGGKETSGSGGSDSNPAAAAGDAESGLRALTGVIGAINPAAGAAVGGVAELLGAVEGLGRLPAAIKGIPGALSAVTTAFGLTSAASTAAATAEAAQTAADGAATVASGTAAVGTLAFVAALGPIAAIGAAVAATLLLVVKGLEALSAQSSETNRALELSYQKNRDVQEAIIQGATKDDALEAIRQSTLRVKNETDNLAKAKKDNDDLFLAIQQKYGDLAARLSALFGLSGFAANNKEIGEATENLKDNQAELKRWNEAIENNETAANDAKKAAEEKEKSDEKAAREAESAAKKAESERERAAAKAAADAEKVIDAQEAIAKSNQQYALKQIDIARQSAQKLQNIQQQARDKTLDTDAKYYTDVLKIAEEARAAEADARRKFDQAEQQADKDANRKLEDLRDDAIASERDALNSRNFLAATKVREGLEESNKKALKDVERAREDRQTAADIEAQDRQIELTKARADRFDALQQERIDNRNALERSVRDARQAQDRQLEEARIAYARESAEKQAHLNELLGIDQAYYAQQTAMAQAAANGGSTQTGIGGGGGAPLGGGAGSFPAGSFPAGGFGGLRPITNNNRTSTNSIVINTDSDQRIIRILEDAGVFRP